MREILKKQFDVSFLCKAINQFTSLQIAASNSVSIFLDIGVPDWRLDKLPDLYQKLLLQKDLLIKNGLLEKDLNELERLIPTVTHLCKKLASYSVKESIVQPDFHDNNLLIDNEFKTITLIDLGEIVISHPFFSLVNFMRQVQFHHALTGKNVLYLQLMNACFENYRSFESKQHLQDAFLIAHTLWFIFEALAHYRLMISCDKTKFKPFQECQKLRNSLQEFVAACAKIDY